MIKNVTIGTFVVVILAVAAAGYLLMTKSATPATHTETTRDVGNAVALEISTATIKEETPKYIIAIQYPHFGVLLIDSQIERMIMDTITSFKKEANADDSGQSAKYELDGQYDKAYVSPDVVSARIIVATYTGGAHPNPAVWGANFDPKTGREYTLNDALKMIGLTLQQVSDQSKKQLQTMLSAADSVLQFPEGADPKPENYAAFVIEKDKVTFLFQTYQVAAYSAGILETSFPRKYQ